MICSSCNQFKLSHEIWRSGRSFVTCKKCRKIKHSAKAKITRDKRFQHRRAFVDWLKSIPCMDCHQSFHTVAMDFDHRDPELKSNDISKLATDMTVSDNDLMNEIYKCDVVCSNCHRLRTFKINRY